MKTFLTILVALYYAASIGNASTPPGCPKYGCDEANSFHSQIAFWNERGQSQAAEAPILQPAWIVSNISRNSGGYWLENVNCVSNGMKLACVSDQGSYSIDTSGNVHWWVPFVERATPSLPITNFADALVSWVQQAVYMISGEGQVNWIRNLIPSARNPATLLAPTVTNCSVIMFAQTALSMTHTLEEKTSVEINEDTSGVIFGYDPTGSPLARLVLTGQQDDIRGVYAPLVSPAIIGSRLFYITKFTQGSLPPHDNQPIQTLLRSKKSSKPTNQNTMISDSTFFDSTKSDSTVFDSTKAKSAVPETEIFGEPLSGMNSPCALTVVDQRTHLDQRLAQRWSFHFNCSVQNSANTGVGNRSPFVAGPIVVYPKSQFQGYVIFGALDNKPPANMDNALAESTLSLYCLTNISDLNQSPQLVWHTTVQVTGTDFTLSKSIYKAKNNTHEDHVTIWFSASDSNKLIEIDALTGHTIRQVSLSTVGKASSIKQPTEKTMGNENSDPIQMNSAITSQIFNERQSTAQIRLTGPLMVADSTSDRSVQYLLAPAVTMYQSDTATNKSSLLGQIHQSDTQAGIVTIRVVDYSISTSTPISFSPFPGSGTLDLTHGQLSFMEHFDLKTNTTIPLVVAALQHSGIVAYAPKLSN